MTNLSIEMDGSGRGSVMVDGIEIPNITKLDVSFTSGRPAEATFTVLAYDVMVRADDVKIGAWEAPRAPFSVSGGTIA